MKIELRKIKHFPATSQETNAFSAEIYVNKKPVGHIRNSGQGESSCPQIPDKKILDEMTQWIQSQPGIDSEYGHLKMTVDFYFSLLVADDLRMRKAKKLFAEHLCCVNEKGELLQSRKVSKYVIQEVMAGRLNDQFSPGNKLLRSAQEIFEVMKKSG